MKVRQSLALMFLLLIVMDVIVAFGYGGTAEHGLLLSAACWAFAFTVTEISVLAQKREGKGQLESKHSVITGVPADDPVPDDLAEYVPDGQGELSRDLLRLMQDQVEEAASRWDAVRDHLPEYRWCMSPEWHAEVKKLKPPLSDSVDVSEEYGVPELVIVPQSEPDPPPRAAVAPSGAPLALLDEAVRAYKEKTILGVLPEDQTEAAALLEQYNRAEAMMYTLVNKPLVLGSDALAMYNGLRAELKAVRDRLKALHDRYEAVKAVEMHEVRVVQSYGIPPMATAPLSSAGGGFVAPRRPDPHVCNGRYYVNIAYCPQHGR